MRTFTVQPDGTMKAMPLNKLPADAWQMLQGQDIGDVGALDIMSLYELVPWLRAGVDMVAQAVANMPVRFYSRRTSDEVDERMTGFKLERETLLNELAGDLLLHGCAYAFIERNLFGIRGIRRLYPKTMRPRYDEQRGLIGYERTVNGKTIPLDLADVIYIPVPNRSGETGHGKSKAFAALRAAGMLDNIDAYGGKLFEQGTIRPNIVWAEGEPSPGDVERLQSFFDRMMTGIRNAFRTIAVRGKMGMMSFGEVPSDLAMPELTDKAREDVATALGIPHSLLFSSAANYATARQDDLHFYSKTVIPLARLIIRTISKRLYEPLGYKLRAHPEELEVFQHLEAEKAEALSYMHDRHVISTNEFRQAMEYEPVDELGEIEADLMGYPDVRGSRATRAANAGEAQKQNAPAPRVPHMRHFPLSVGMDKIAPSVSPSRSKPVSVRVPESRTGLSPAVKAWMRRQEQAAEGLRLARIAAKLGYPPPPELVPTLPRAKKSAEEKLEEFVWSVKRAEWETAWKKGRGRNGESIADWMKRQLAGDLPPAPPNTRACGLAKKA